MNFRSRLIDKTAVIVVENTLPRILPLLTVTGISYLKTPTQARNDRSRLRVADRLAATAAATV